MRRIYDWERWFGEGRFTLFRGTHYWISQATMHQTIRNNASARGLRVRMKDKGNCIDVEVVGERSNPRGVVPTGCG